MNQRFQLREGEPDLRVFDTADDSRYQLLRDLCQGKRVLDIGCGERYGADLLARWGARQVVAIDVSDESIASTRRRFRSDRIVLEVSDANKLAGVVSRYAPFDVIVCFGCVERVVDPEAVLAAIGQLRTSETSIVISVTNAFASRDGFETSKFGRKFDFGSVRSLTEGFLGEAGDWLLGAPMEGVALVNMRSLPRDGSVKLDVRPATPSGDYLDFVINPPLARNRPEPDNVLFWVGSWNAPGAVSALALPSYLTNWREASMRLDPADAEPVTAKEEEADKNLALISDLGFVLGERERAIAALTASAAEELAKREAEIHKLKTALAEREEAIADLNVLLDVERVAKNTEIRRLGVVLAEERRASSFVRTRLDDLSHRDIATEVLSNQAILKGFAQAVCREQRQRSFVYRFRHAIKSVFGFSKKRG